MTRMADRMATRITVMSNPTRGTAMADVIITSATGTTAIMVIADIMGTTNMATMPWQARF